MSRKLLITVVIVLLASLAFAGLATAATPRGITVSGQVTSIDTANQTFTVTGGPNTKTYNNHFTTLYFGHPNCQVNNFSELMVGNVVGVWALDVGSISIARAVVIFPAVCPQNP